jgi:histidinol phosphatase-like enzyme
MKRNLIVALDKDGTLVFDNDNFLGADSNWKKQIKLLEGVCEGTWRMSLIPDTYIYITTNQAGVALVGRDSKTGIDFDEMTKSRMSEVVEYTKQLIEQQGGHIDGWMACPFVDNKYVEKSERRNRSVDSQFVVPDGNRDMKPNIGMLEKIAIKIGSALGECRIVTIGDRCSDVMMALNAYEEVKADAYGILVPSWKTEKLGDFGKVGTLQRKYPGRVYIAMDNSVRPGFLEAVDIVEKIAMK